MIYKHSKKRRGTAEVIGTASFLVILFASLANMLWYNQATIEMNKHFSQKANSQIELETTDGSILEVKATGSHDVEIIGLWIIESDLNHNYTSFTSHYIPAGSSINIDVSGYTPGSGDITFKIITDIGNIAIISHSYTP